MCFMSIHISYASTSDATAKECFENPEMPKCNDSGEEDQESSSPLNQSEQEEAPSVIWTVIKLVLALGFVILLIYALLKFVNKRNQMFSNVRTMQNLGGISLGQQKSLQMVRIGNRYYVVGVGDNVELLTEIEDEQTIQELSESSQGESFNPGARIASLLSNSKGQQSQASKDSDSSIQFQQLFQSELKSLKDKRKKVIQKQQEKKEDSHE